MKQFYFLLSVSFIIAIISCKKHESSPKNRVIHVPDNINSIQEAINKANDFDTILVSNGTYEENINFNGKRVYLVSFYNRTLDTMDIKNTIIKGKNGSVIRFENGEDSTSVIQGFTLTNGSPGIHPGEYIPYHFNGGSIYIKNSTPTLKNLIIEENHMYIPNSTGTGGGIYCDSGGIKATNVIIRNNYCGSGQGGGGGIYASSSKVILKKCEITNNHTEQLLIRNGIYFNNVTLFIEDSKIENNWNIKNIFGPINLISNSNGIMLNTIINDSITFQNSSIDFKNCVINDVTYP